MNPLLQTHFDTALEHPNGIKKLRELILTLAMQGKLVEQDPKDQPASELLIEIQAEKARLVAEGKIIDRKPGFLKLPVKNRIPKHWEKIYIRDLCDLKTGATPSTSVQSFYNGEIKWLVSGDINKQEIYDCEGRISESGLKNSNCKLLPVDSVMIALNGQGKTRATVALLKTEAACNQSLVAMIPLKRNSDLSKFLFKYFKSIYIDLRNLTGDDKRSGLNMKLIADVEVPLPPLAEQKRIVEKVGQLMALCDTLEEGIEKAEEKRGEILEGMVRG